MRKSYANDDAAKLELKELNEDCHIMVGNIHSIVDRLSELGRYYKTQTDAYNSYLNATRMKNAGSDMTVLSRKLLNVTSDLKLISKLEFPRIDPALEEEIKRKKEELTNKKVNKNAKVKRKREEETIDGEEAIPARRSS